MAGDAAAILAPDSWATRVRSLRWTARSRVFEHPAPLLAVARRRHPRAVLGDDTELLIDGFTRSAVTFAVIAFQVAQRRPVRVAHTLHAAGHVLAAVRGHVPALVTIRAPDDAVLSALIREPYIGVGRAFDAYARFYERVLPYRDAIVVAPFEEVTQRFGDVVDRVNGRFGTTYARFEHTDEAVDEVFSIIEDRAAWPPWADALGAFESGVIGVEEYRRIVRERRDGWERDVPELRVQRPSEARVAIKQELRARLDDRRVRGRRDRAARAYEALVASG